MAAPPVALNDVIQVSYYSEWQSQRIMLITNWKVNDLADPGDYLADMTSIANHFANPAAGFPLALYLPLLGADVVVKTVRAQRVYAPRSGFVEVIAEEAGTAESDAVTGNVAAAVTRKTDGAGRSQLSISHIGPIPISGYDNGVLTAPFKASLEAWAVEWLTEQAIAGGSGMELLPVVFHANDVVPSADPLINYIVNPYVRTMRRRTVGLGI